jgi:hypothetical protein
MVIENREIYVNKNGTPKALVTGFIENGWTFWDIFFSNIP